MMVIGGPVAMLPPMAGASALMGGMLVVIAGALVGMARTPSAGALPPTAETLMGRASEVTAGTVRAGMLLVIAA
ncbi:hypothetical protein [Microtetraspora malaysiensis]|uniref:hypothetical protein n=1 Tax=Microtetraspora malaysiensis TaxID=161358 RepID=UPI003D910090